MRVSRVVPTERAIETRCPPLYQSKYTFMQWLEHTDTSQETSYNHTVAQRLPRFKPHVQREAAKLDKLVEEVEFAATAGATRPATASGSERVTRPYEAEEEC
jgi:hypothetical protein